MRPIKFRAWCEGIHGNITFTKPFMDYNVTIVDGKYASVEGGWDIHGTYETIPLMQFTGLLDRNGKEIWEGDLVECYTKSGEKVYDHPQKVEVPDFYRTIWSENEYGMPADLGQNIKVLVVGNIYENPELITI